MTSMMLYSRGAYVTVRPFTGQPKNMRASSRCASKVPMLASRCAFSAMCSLRLAVRTLASHAGNRGSIPLGSANFPLALVRFGFFEPGAGPEHAHPVTRNTVKMKHCFRTTWSVGREPVRDALPVLVIKLMCYPLLPAEELIRRLK